MCLNLIHKCDNLKPLIYSFYSIYLISIGISTYREIEDPRLSSAEHHIFFVVVSRPLMLELGFFLYFFF